MPRLRCVPTDGPCHPCVDVDQDQPYCVANGFKQEVACSYRNRTAAYVTFESCPLVPGDFTGVLRFELLMIIVFAFSFSFVTKRKRRLMQVQQDRIASYVDP